MKILMLGGTRFIGRAAVTDLTARGHEVTVLNRGQLPGHPSATRAITCDKNDRDALSHVLAHERWDAVMDTLLDDTDLEFIIDRLVGKVAHFIHTGSIGVYAPCTRIPARETDPLACHDAEFSFSHKLRQDQVLMRAHLERSFPGTSLRKSYIYGPGMVLLDGWGGRNPKFFQMLRDRETIPLAHGGLALLHPGYVADLARAFGDALESPRTIGQCYNIGGHGALTMRDYLSLIARIMGVEPKFEFTSPQQILDRFGKYVDRRGLLFACEHMCCDITKAERDMNWRPTTPLEVGLANSIAWMTAQGHI